MKKRITLFLAILISIHITLSATFTPGNIVVYRIGDGSAPLANTGSPIFLDEYTPAGTLVQSIAMPTIASGANKALVASGTATSEGLLSTSADGRYIFLTGYDGVAGSSLAGTTGTAKNRVIGRVDANGTINTTTALTDYADGNNPRSVASTNGTDIWLTGGAGGLRYTTLGSTTSIQLSTTVTNIRQVNVFVGQLYISTSSGSAVRIGSVGTGTPTTAGQTIANLPGIPSSTGSPYNFFFADLDAGIAGVDVLYIADDAAGILKYSLVGGTWVTNGSVIASSVRGLIGSVNGNAVALYATTGGSGATGGGSIYSFTDNTGYNATISGSVTTIVSASTNIAFRGITFAPVTICTPVNIATEPISPSAVCSGSGGTAVFTVGVNGTSPFVYQWQENSSNISDGGVYSGVTTPTLTITNPTTALNGKTYRCVVTNCLATASIISNNTATLMVDSFPLQPGAFTISSSTVNQGQNGVVYTVPNDPTVTYTWSYSGTGVTINNSGNSITVDFSTSATSGILEVMATNGCGTSSTRTIAVTVTINTGTVNSKIYTWKTPSKLGVYNGVDIMEGGSSGLCYIKGSNNEFYTLTDRGPNLDANDNTHIANNPNADNAKLFALPSFNPQIIHWKAVGDSLQILGTITLKRPDGAATSGLPNPVGGGYSGELALLDTNGTEVNNLDTWGIDSEGIAEGNDNDFWICEEYGTTVWRVNKTTGQVINRYAPFPVKQAEDLDMDTIFKFRNPNKGLEGVAFSSIGKVYAFIQNSILYPTNDANLKKNTRLHRFIEIDPVTNATRMFGYEHDKVPSGSNPLNTIKNDKRYIGDAAAINDHEFLILEHGKSSTESYAKIYKIDIAGATAINPSNHLAYNGKSFEQLLDSANAKTNGVTVVKKTLFLDLIANGYDPNIEKQEGLAILNDSTIAISNDNDFGIVSPNEDGNVVANGVKTYLHIFTVPQSQKLNLCDQTVIMTASSVTTFCQGDSVVLTTSTTGSAYQWRKDGINIGNSTTANYSAKSAGNYDVMVTNGGCIGASNFKKVSVNPLPVASITSAGNTTFCQGGSVSLSANGSGTTYSWSNGATGQTINVSSAGNYLVTITDANTCTAVSSPTTVTVNTLPTTPTITQTGAMLTSTAGSSYQWYLNGNPISLATNQNYTFVLAGNYSVKITDINGCEATSLPLSVVVTGITSLTTPTSVVKLYPIPTEDVLTISMTLEKDERIIIRIYDLQGKEVTQLTEKNLAKGEQQVILNTSDLTNGTYFVQISSATYTSRVKTVIIH